MPHSSSHPASLSRRALRYSGVLAVAALALAAAQPALAQATDPQPIGPDLQLTQQWDKVFPKSDRVDHQKVTFTNRYGITLVGDLYLPKGRGDTPPTIMPMIRFEQTDHHAYSAQLRRQGQAIGQYTIVVIQFPIANLAGHPAAVSNKIIVITNE